jgi:hypothetical protein
MVAGEASDLYASDTYPRSATSIAQRMKDEPAVNNHPPPALALIRGLPQICNKCALIEHICYDVLMIDAYAYPV